MLSPTAHPSPTTWLTCAWVVRRCLRGSEWTDAAGHGRRRNRCPCLRLPLRDQQLRQSTRGVCDQVLTLRDIRGRHVRTTGKVGRQRLDRLQEVIDLALEEGETGRTISCADIGADHGLLAIGLHANGVGVTASDVAAGPLAAARETIRAYLGHRSPSLLPNETAGDNRDSNGEEEPAAPVPPECPLVPVGSGQHKSLSPPSQPQSSGETMPRLECRLGSGLSVVGEGEVDTVCIAGMGVYTMISILQGVKSCDQTNETKEQQCRDETGAQGKEEEGPNSLASIPLGPYSAKGVRHAGTGGSESSSARGYPPLLLQELGVRRLVLQPMDARLIYIRDLRSWLWSHGWRITQERIVSASGKGGARLFLTLRAEACPKDLGTGAAAMADRRGGHGGDRGTGDDEDGTTPDRLRRLSLWLGDFLPPRAMDRARLGTEEGKEEAEVYLSYLRHQSKWLRVIGDARGGATASSVCSSSATAAAAATDISIVGEIESVVAEIASALKT